MSECIRMCVFVRAIVNTSYLMGVERQRDMWLNVNCHWYCNTVREFNCFDFFVPARIFWTITIENDPSLRSENDRPTINIILFKKKLFNLFPQKAVFLCNYQNKSDGLYATRVAFCWGHSTHTHTNEYILIPILTQSKHFEWLQICALNTSNTYKIYTLKSQIKTKIFVYLFVWKNWWQSK